MEGIKHTILAKLRTRLAEEDEHPVNERGDTERFDRLLALWIDLQRAIHLRPSHQTQAEGCTPWNCHAKAVQDAWEALTNPKNVVALESLYYQLPDGPQMDMARKALQACRQRRDAEQAKA